MPTKTKPLEGSAGGGAELALFEQIMRGLTQARMPAVIESTMSLRPDIYTALMAACRPILFEGSLPVSVKQMIVLQIAHRRGCDFCSDAHRALLEAAGIEPALIENCLEDPEMKLLPPMYRQITGFALRAADDPNGVDDGLFEQLRDSGLNEAEILEVAMAASLANFLVTWGGVRAPLDDQPQS